MAYLAVVLVVSATLSLSTGLPAQARGQSNGFGSAKHVIIFGCDGFGESAPRRRSYFMVSASVKKLLYNLWS